MYRASALYADLRREDLATRPWAPLGLAPAVCADLRATGHRVRGWSPSNAVACTSSASAKA